MSRINTHLGGARRNRLRLGGQPFGTGPHPEALFGTTEDYLPPAAKPDPPTSHASQSAGYHADLSVPGYQGETPVAAPEPSQAAQGPAGHYAGARRAYTRSIAALPPPIAALSSPLAPAGLTTLGRTAARSPLSLLSSGLQAILSPPPAAPSIAVPKPGSPEAMILSSDPSKPAHLPADPADPLGKKTLGDVNAAELELARADGTLRVGPGGRLSTPEVRSAIAKLEAAQQAVMRTSAGTLPGLTPAGSRVARTVFRTGEQSDESFKELLAAAETGLVESHFENLSGGDADSQGWRQERASIYGPDATRPRQGALNFFEETDQQAGATAGELAANVQRPAEEYRGRYDDVKPEAMAVLRAYKKGSQPSPEAAQALQVAKQNARAEGINPTRFNGDVAGGDGNFTIVRADAKGMTDWAESALGTVEGSPKAERWGARFGLNTVTQPWCANFISNGLVRRGFSDAELPANPNFTGTSSPGYQAWGEEGKYAKIVDGGLEAAKPGDILTFGAGGNRHVGVYVGGGEYISGNSSDAVNRNPVDSDLSAVIRPNYKGGKVRVEDSQVTGSTATSALGGTATAVSGGAISPAGAAAAAGEAPTSRPAMSSLTALTNPTAVGPVLPTIPGVGAPDEHVASAAENLMTLLGEETATGRPIL